MMQINSNTVLSLADCLKYADETKELVIKKNALVDIPGILPKFFEFETVCLVADENTFDAAGSRVKKAPVGQRFPRVFFIVD